MKPLTMGQRILGTGHSYHEGFVGLLADVAKSGGFPDHQTAGESEIPGSFLYQQWAAPGVQDKLKSGSVDVLTTTPIYLPDDGIEKFARLGHEQHVRMLLMEMWLPFDENQPCYYEGPPGCPGGLIPRPAHVDHNAQTSASLHASHDPYFKQVDDLIAGINQDLGEAAIELVPTGQAVLALREKVIAGQVPTVASQTNLFNDDLGHPGKVLRVLDVYCHFAVIYHKTPVGLPVPSLLANGAPSEDISQLNAVLQEVAWNAVTSHPLSGVTKLACP